MPEFRTLLSGLLNCQKGDCSATLKPKKVNNPTIFSFMIARDALLESSNLTKYSSFWGLVICKICRNLHNNVLKALIAETLRFRQKFTIALVSLMFRTFHDLLIGDDCLIIFFISLFFILNTLRFFRSSWLFS